MEIVIGAVVALIIGVAGGFLFGKRASGNKAKEIEESAKKEAERLIEEAKREGENIKKDRILESKEKYLQQKAEFEQFRNEKMAKLKETENEVRIKEQALQKQREEIKQQRENLQKSEQSIQSTKDNLNRQLEIVGKRKEELEKAQSEHVKKLEQIARLSIEEARSEMMEALKAEVRTSSQKMLQEIVEDAKLRASKEAKKVIIQTIQRTASETTIENTVSTFPLTSDDQKGQIIGREGRNIRALEAATGVEIVVDDTPETIVISGYDPVRREIARLSLQKLVADGRIHPARIEEVVAKVTRQLDEQIADIGNRTVVELGIHGLNPELVKIVGRMRFRSSYGQNLLQHSREVAHLSATLAAELGLDQKMVKAAKRAGLLHDIGKVPDTESELTHAILGMKWCEKYGESPAICNAVGAHHDEIEMGFIISPLIQIADSISGARPGARRETLDSYLKRIKELEDTALAFEGVDKVFAIQAGRELRIMVESEKVSDEKADQLSFEIAQKIQNEMQYPGQIKVTVIRERRAINYAK